MKQGNRSYTLPLIEVVRSILAPNRFLLYRLFEMNSFPQYFIENYYPNKIHLDFSSLYNIKYTKTAFLYQLVWLLTNRDLRSVFENVAYTFNNKGSLQFEWSFTQLITIRRAIVKPNASGSTVLRVVSVKNKQIPYKEITYEHPEIAQSTKANEPKKYILQTKNNLTGQQDEMILDEEIEGATDDFDVIEMDNQMHEYITIPKVTKVPRRTNKKREFEDENTKKRFINSDSNRSTADVGGNQVTKGLEQQSLIDVQIDGELGEFIKIMRVLQDFPEVQSINIIQGSLKEFSDTKRFVYLSDGVTERKCVIAEVRLFSGNEASLIEVEREDKALSTLILFANNLRRRDILYRNIFNIVISRNGNWNKEQLHIEKVNFVTLRHGKKHIEHRAKKILEIVY